MDRENIGGNMSGPAVQLRVARRQHVQQQKWSLDGVDITDMAATGASPAYYDFDAFEEMTINTGGVDVDAADRRRRHQTSSPRAARRSLQGLGPVLSALNDSSSRQQPRHDARSQGATSRQPDPGHQDYGFEMGGPLKEGQGVDPGQLHAKQNIKVGVLGFLQA